MKSTLFVIGAGGHAKVVVDCLRLQGCYQMALVDETESRSASLEGVPVLSALPEGASGEFFVAIGDNYLRKQKFEQMISKGLQPAKLIHPASVISTSSIISPGTIVCAGAIVGPSARVGANCIVNTCASIDHDCEVHDHAHVSVGARICGNVEVGEGAFIGAGSTVIPRVSIGTWSILGAGTVVIKDVAPRNRLVGVPARIISAKGESQ